MRICLMTGARPNFIKVAPIIRAICQHPETEVSYSLVYAGCPDDPTLESSIFDDLQMPRPDVFLGVASSNPNEISSLVMAAFEDYLQQNKTDVVIVVDDLASTMAAAIVAKKEGILLAHLVAGTRSFDINMPKEINRLVIDGLSDFLFTAGSGIGTTADPAKIYNVGNILIDTLRNNLPRFKSPAILSDKALTDGEYAVLTINRKALLSNEAVLSTLLATMSRKLSLPLVAPLRDAAAATVKRLSETFPNLILCDPLPYLEFGYLTSHARLIITDSGNIAEEATFNGIPCITLNNYTEHIETVKEGTNILVNEDPQMLSDALDTVLCGGTKQFSIPDRWDGRTAERIVKIILENSN